ncbi:MAG: nodulation protein NfeD [Acidobacteriota bacterium]|nr:nodulation protein NfeD [Acidobacteriota bacterium]
MLLLALFFANDPVRTALNPPPETPRVVQLRLNNEAITPVTARFIARAIREAEKQQAKCLIIMLDTPGGLVDSTREMVKAILHSKVPVIVYVAPTGARAASAGVFITMSSHIAVMAPGTNIGAAHPVQIGGLPGSQPPQPAERQPEKQSGDKKDDQNNARTTTPMEDKILNDTVAWARSLAELRGRNADWAERAVKDSISVTATEAVKAGAVDFVAKDLNELLARIEGREVQLEQGKAKLQVTGASVQTLEMWWGERVLAAIANPTLAFLLLIFGFYGILFEFYTPGWGVAGTIGVICLVLGFFAMAVLPISYVGLALIVIALAMFVAEAFVVSYGFLSIGGAICLIIGGLMLVESPTGFMRVPLWAILPVSLATAVISFFLVGAIIKTHLNPPQTGSEAVAGSKAVADEDFRPDGGLYHGRVRYHGEWWNAVSRTPVEKSEELVVESRDGLMLAVRTTEATSGEK